MRSQVLFLVAIALFVANPTPAFAEYETMDLEMLREVVPMLRQQLEKSMLDRNYVQLERVSVNEIASSKPPLK